MIKILGLVPAVLASIAVALEDRSAIHRDPSLIGNPHVPFESHDRRRRQRQRLGSPERSIRDEHVGPIPKHEHQSASHRNHRERFEAGVQNKGSWHAGIVPATSAASTDTKPLSDSC